ncbi:Uncharacterised protein [uncultured archaeon]|nr:Uncharacterised protein [uncultured archaeon]
MKYSLIANNATAISTDSTSALAIPNVDSSTKNTMNPATVVDRNSMNSMTLSRKGSISMMRSMPAPTSMEMRK